MMVARLKKSGQAMSYGLRLTIAIQEPVNGKVVEWMEHVTEEQYRR